MSSPGAGDRFHVGARLDVCDAGRSSDGLPLRSVVGLPDAGRSGDAVPLRSVVGLSDPTGPGFELHLRSLDGLPDATRFDDELSVRALDDLLPGSGALFLLVTKCSRRAEARRDAMDLGDAIMFERECTLYAFTMGYARLLAEDIDDARFAEQPAPGLNHPAWILGHLAICTDYAAGLLGLPAACPKPWASCSAPARHPGPTARSTRRRSTFSTSSRRDMNESRRRLATLIPRRLLSHIPWKLPS